MDDAFNTQDLIDAINQVKSVNSYNDVQVLGNCELCELPNCMKELFELYNIKYIKMPTEDFGQDIDKNTFYIVPKYKPYITIKYGDNVCGMDN